jgi:hypothetical protein
MKKDKCRIDEYKIPIYGARLHVVQARDFVPAWNALFPNAPPATPGAYGLSWFDCEKLTGYVGLESTANEQTIAHEALHITHDLLRTIGHHPSYDNNEAECYLLGYVVLLLTPDKKAKLKPYPKP